MIGPKKLSTIRQQLKSALAATGDDPLRWLEERMTTPVCQATAVEQGNEVLHSLHRFLNRPAVATTSQAPNPNHNFRTETKMSDKQFNKLSDRVAQLEAEVEQLKAGSGCGEGWQGIVGSQKDNPFFLEVIAEIEKDRAAEKAAMAVTPAKKRTSRRAATTKK